MVSDSPSAAATTVGEVGHVSSGGNADNGKNVGNASGGDLIFVRYRGAEHSYDTPSSKRQAVAANVAATEDTKLRAEAFFKSHLMMPLEKAKP